MQDGTVYGHPLGLVDGQAPCWLVGWGGGGVCGGGVGWDGMGWGMCREVGAGIGKVSEGEKLKGHGSTDDG